MGLFSKLFGKGDNNSNESADESPVIFVEQDKLMEEAGLKARQTFKYFWRELYWEGRRIIKGLDLAIVKFSFAQEFEGQEELVVEHMWVNNISFDGETVSGDLMNAPHQLSSVAVGDRVRRNLSETGDWMFVIQGKTYGGFTIQAMRSMMSAKEKKAHDSAWGLDFGDVNHVLLVNQQDEHPENLIEHPMCINMAEKVREFLQQYPDQITEVDEDGLTMLHREAIAGNKSNVQILLEAKADLNKTSKSGKTALAYAQMMEWEHLFEVLG